MLPALVAAVTASAGDVAGQIRASERGGVFQVVDGTKIRIEYGRPHAKGRELYGNVLPWGKIWSGANWATTFEVDRDITINGHALAAGKYSFWLELQPEEWTAIIDPQPRRFHMNPPRESDDQVRFKVTPVTGPHVEALTWTFPEVRSTGTTLQLAWGEKRVSFDIGVQPSRPVEVAPDVAERYVGSYRLTYGEQFGGREVAFDIRYENGRLMAKWESSPLVAEPILVPLGANMFVPGDHDESGGLLDVMTEFVFEFTPIEGRATGFELRALDDRLWGTAVRSN